MVDQFLITFAFVAGFLAIFSPCGYALLPGYAAYLLGGRTGIREAVISGFSAVCGIVTVYAAVGVLTGLVGALLSTIIPWLSFIASLVVLAMGVSIYVGIRIPMVGLRTSLTTLTSGGFYGFYLYGLSYGLAAQACTAPIFISILSVAAASGKPADAFMILISYSVGAAVPIIVTTVLVSQARKLALDRLKRLTPTLYKLSGILLIAVGIYIIMLNMGLIYIYGWDVILFPKKAP